MNMQQSADRPNLDPHPLSPYVAWAGGRNRDPILSVLQSRLPAQAGRVLEFASGSGMHINYFAPHFRHLTFQPTDLNQEVFANIRRLAREQGNENLRDPLPLDLTQPETWPSGEEHVYDTIFCINIFQVAPISIAEGMMQCASRLLRQGGFLSIYGPFVVDGRHTTDSNQAFDQEVRSAGVAEWGLKDVADLKKAASRHGMELKEQIDMPANNFMLIFAHA
jgi:cyclopropane fatty-acyl-phospholipid synthase-like methyltransferase